MLTVFHFRGHLNTFIHTVHLLQRLDGLSALPVGDVLQRLLAMDGGTGQPTALLGSKHIVCWGVEDMLNTAEKEAAGAVPASGNDQPKEKCEFRSMSLHVVKHPKSRFASCYPDGSISGYGMLCSFTYHSSLQGFRGPVAYNRAQAPENQTGPFWNVTWGTMDLWKIEEFVILVLWRGLQNMLGTPENSHDEDTGPSTKRSRYQEPCRVALSCFNEAERGSIMVSPCCPSVLPSVRPCIRPSVHLWTESCPLCIFNNTRWTHFHNCTSYQATSEGLSRVKFVSKFKN